MKKRSLVIVGVSILALVTISRAEEAPYVLSTSDGKYNEDVWTNYTGKTLQSLGDEWKKGLEEKLNAQAAASINARVAKSKFGKMANFAKSDLGYISLQGDHGQISFRNIKVRPIEPKR